MPIPRMSEQFFKGLEGDQDKIKAVFVFDRIRYKQDKNGSHDSILLLIVSKTERI